MEIAQRITHANHAKCIRYGWNASRARCQRLLARCDLATGQPDIAGGRLEEAVTTFRDGDLLLELAATLVDLAEQQRQTGRLESAERTCAEVFEIIAPRELVPTHAAALAVRARIRADGHAATGAVADLDKARDDAAGALRLATTIRALRWQELGALHACAYIDLVAGTDEGWAAKAGACRAELVPPDLDADPLATEEAPES